MILTEIMLSRTKGKKNISTTRFPMLFMTEQAMYEYVTKCEKTGNYASVVWKREGN